MALKIAMHNWMRPGADRDDDHAARPQRLQRDRDLWRAGGVRRRPRQGGCWTSRTLECWGSVTLMTGGRDLVHEDHYVRLASVQYVKDCLSLVASLGGKILTVVPSTVGKVVPMGVARGGVAVGRRGPQGVPGPRRAGRRADRDRAAQPLRDLLHQPRRPGRPARQGRRRQLRRALDIFHMNIEEADWARRSATPATTWSTSTSRTTTGCRAARARSTGRGSSAARRDRLRRLPHGRVRRPRRPLAAVAAHRDRRRRGRGRQPGHGAVPPRPRHRRLPEHYYDRYVQDSIDRLRKAIDAVGAAA